MLTQIITFEHHPRFVGGALGGKAVGGGVDRGHPPAVAVADLVDALAAAVPRAWAQLDGDVFAAAHDQIADPDLLITRTAHTGPGRDERVMQAPVQRVGHLPGVTDQQRVDVRGAVFQVGLECVGRGERLALTGWQL